MPKMPPREISQIRKNISLEPFHTWRKDSGLPLPQTPEANEEMWARYRYETGKKPPVGFGKNPVETRGWNYDPNSSTNIYKQPPLMPTGNQPQPSTYTPASIYNTGVPAVGVNPTDVPFNYGNTPAGPQPSNATDNFTPVPQLGTTPTTTDQFQAPQMGTEDGGQGYRGATPYKRGRRSTLPTVLP